MPAAAASAAEEVEEAEGEGGEKEEEEEEEEEKEDEVVGLKQGLKKENVEENQGENTVEVKAGGEEEEEDEQGEEKQQEVKGAAAVPDLIDKPKERQATLLTSKPVADKGSAVVKGVDASAPGSAVPAIPPVTLANTQAPSAATPLKAPSAVAAIHVSPQMDSKLFRQSLMVVVGILALAGIIIGSGVLLRSVQRRAVKRELKGQFEEAALHARERRGADAQQPFDAASFTIDDEESSEIGLEIQVVVEANDQDAELEVGIDAFESLDELRELVVDAVPEMFNDDDPIVFDYKRRGDGGKWVRVKNHTDLEVVKAAGCIRMSVNSDRRSRNHY